MSLLAVGVDLSAGLKAITEEGFIETLAGGQWTAIAAPTASRKSAHSRILASVVACPAVGSCVAGGGIATKSGKKGHGVLDTLSGGTWTPVAVPLPADATPGSSTSFISVSCPATGACVAAASYFDTSGSEQGLIETSAGTTWAATEAPLPANAGPDPNAALGGVTCPAPGSCVAVGSYTDATGAQEGVVDTLSAGTWSATEAPLPAEITGGITSVGGFSPSPTSHFSFTPTRAHMLARDLAKASAW